MPAVLNAANEIAVEAFLDRRVKFTDISVIIESAMDKIAVASADSLEIVLEIDQQTRTLAHQIIAEMNV
jgi:1-deoxy-D-xylulose-5-phosphate reductoisomerase